MHYSDLVQYFQSEETLTELLADCQPYFDAIDDYNEKIFKNELTETTILEVREGKRKVSAAKANLEAIQKSAETFKRNNELQKYMELKNSTPKGEKFTSASGEKEAEAFVQLPRRVRNMIEGYIAKAETALKQLSDMLYDAKWDADKKNAV
ncbi:MAG TPA: hypothetical protein VGB37_06445 [Candidatus Lokiarchaeia archaeon]